MIASLRRQGAVVLAAGALAWPALATSPTPAGAVGWSAPFRLGGPAAVELIAPQIAISPGGTAAVAFGVQDVDQPSRSTAYLAIRSRRGRVARARRVPQAQQVLDLAYERSALELLTGTSPRKYPCCSSALAIRLAHGRFGAPRRLVGALTGATEGRLIALSGRLVAAIATEHGVWAAQAAAGGGFAAARRLTSTGALPESLDATQGSGNQAVLAWSAASSRYGPGPRGISVASGPPLRYPSRAISVAPGHRIDELAVVHATAGVTVGWTESWFDRFGRYHSVVMAADLLTRARRELSSTDALASGLAFASDAGGSEALAWRECDSAGSCVAKLALRGAHGHFRGVQELGAIDPGQAPAVAVGPHAATLAGWIAGGQVRVAHANAGRGTAGAPTLLDGAPYGSDLALTYAPRRGAMASWIEGTFQPSVLGAWSR